MNANVFDASCNEMAKSERTRLTGVRLIDFMLPPNEGSKSLRPYFVIAAGLSPIPWDEAISNGSRSTLAAVPWFVNMAFAVLFLTIAIRLEKLLPQPTLIKVVLAASMAWTAIRLAVSLQSGPTVSSVTSLMLSLLVCAYVLKRVVRLAREIAPKTT